MYTNKTYGLQEVKKGQTGKGLLIENDGHIIGNVDTIQQIKEDIEHHNKFVIPDKFSVKAVFQKYGIKNANGRVYPEEILKREVDKYINTKIKTRASIGALDHPACLEPDTKILTKDGWSFIQYIKEGDAIYTLNKNNELEIKYVNKKIESYYEGTMIRLQCQDFDLTVTPNHKFPIYDNNFKFIDFYTTQEIFDNKIPNQEQYYLLKMTQPIVNSNIKDINNDNSKLINLELLLLSEIPYQGMVYCVEVDNHNFYVMGLDGNCIWTGNSSTLSGHDVSHVITDLEWQGRTLIGEMELHLSPGYRKYGVCSTSGDKVANLIIDNILIGVSSRAVGSVEEKLGVLMVGDDLELLCWDVVCEPSTPNAFIAKDIKDLQQFIESDETNINKPIINEKINKINEILL